MLSEIYFLWYIIYSLNLYPDKNTFPPIEIEDNKNENS